MCTTPNAIAFVAAKSGELLLLLLEQQQQQQRGARRFAGFSTARATTTTQRLQQPAAAAVHVGFRCEVRSESEVPPVARFVNLRAAAKGKERSSDKEKEKGSLCYQY
jgi:hypothetical protein